MNSQYKEQFVSVGEETYLTSVNGKGLSLRNDSACERVSNGRAV